MKIVEQLVQKWYYNKKFFLGEVYMINNNIVKTKFKDIDVHNPFFNSLEQDYGGTAFLNWFKKKAEEGESGYVLYVNGEMNGFLYLKDETEEDLTITPVFERKRRLKIGTFKINAHGTVLGHRFLSIALKEMIDKNFDFCYLTLFDKQKGLIRLFEKFGFKLWGRKSNGELVYYKDLYDFDDIYKNFPRFNKKNKKYLLSIYPKFHTRIFPDSQLSTEKNHMVEDLSYTNSIEKIYITKMRKVAEFKKGDKIVIYRTAGENVRAEYISVATSICTVAELSNMYDYTLDEFLSYCKKGSIFTEDELRSFYKQKKYPYIIKMLYNIPLNKKIIRHVLAEEVGLIRDEYWGCYELTDYQFDNILKKGEINESFIIN